MDFSVVLQGLFIFHSGLALFFWIAYCLLTGKRSAKLGDAAFMTMLAVFPGLLVTYLEVGWDPLWVNVTGFQLTLGSTYVLASTLHERAQPGCRQSTHSTRGTFVRVSNGKKRSLMRLQLARARSICLHYYGKSV